MKTKYPIVLVHGIIFKDNKLFKSFGRIQKKLKEKGYCVSTADTDGFGSIENNAEQLKNYIIRLLNEQSAEKVNIIAHSKGGLDTKYMIENLGMGDKVASLTTLCTPHRGSQIATKLLKLPKFVTKFIAFWVNVVYRVSGDKMPDALKVCNQLQAISDGDYADLDFAPEIYCQSYSATMKRSKDDFVMSIPFTFSKRWEHDFSDGLVSKRSSEFGHYRGDCFEESLSHSEVVDFMAKKSKREKVYGFYYNLCAELAEMGF